MEQLVQQNFYLIRHGETEMNAKRLCCGGGVDTVLTDTGRMQAELARRVLEVAPVKPTLIIHSNMSRTRETAAILNRTLDIPVKTDSELREHMMGEWEGKTWDEALPHLLSNAKPAGGENMDEFASRVSRALNRNLYEHQDERVMFVGHGGIFHSILRLYNQSRDVFIPNATLHDFVPAPDCTQMPWQIDLLGMNDAGIIKREAANICPVRFSKAG